MKYIVEIADNKTEIAEAFFKSVSFIKNVKQVAVDEITNPLILQSIENYEKNRIKPTSLNLKELREMVNA